MGLIVDSDLGNISAYNQRKKPILDPFFLPPNVQLVYATSDAGKSVVNKSLAIADSIALQTFRAIDANPQSFSVTQVESPWYEGFEVLFPRTKTS